MHVARSHLLSQEKAYLLAISYIFFVFKHLYKSKFEMRAADDRPYHNV